MMRNDYQPNRESKMQRLALLRSPPSSPLVWVAVLFVVGALGVHWLWISPLWALPPLLVGMGLLVWGGFNRRKLALVAALLVALAAGAGLYGTARGQLERERARIDTLSGAIPLTLRVADEVKTDSPRQRTIVGIIEAPESLNDLVGTRLSLGVYDDEGGRIRPGDLLSGEFRLSAPRAAANPLLFDYGDYLTSRGVAGWANVVGKVEVTGRSPGILTIFLRVREWLSSRIERGLQPAARPLARALLLGERDALPDEDWESFRLTGVVHLLVVSGLHVGIIGYIVFLLTGLLPIKRRGRYLIALIAVLLFTLLTGARPPTVRASLMAVLYLGGRFLGRPANLGSSVAGAGLILLAINPLQLGQISFQLSFAAAAGIAAITPPLERYLRGKGWWGWVATGLAATAGAQLGLFPLLALYFARLPLLGSLLNLIAVPLVTLILTLGLPYLLLTVLWSGISAALGTPLSLALRLLDGLVESLHKLPAMTVPLRQPTLWLVIASFALLGVAWWLWRRREQHRWLGWLPLGIIALLWSWQLLRNDYPEQLRLTFFDVERGDCILIESPAGDRVVIDGGLDRYDPLADYLNRRGIERIDTVFLSHPNADHYAGLIPLFGQCAVERVCRPPDYLVTDLYGRYLLTEAVSGVEIINPPFGYQIPTHDESLELTVLSASDQPISSANENDASLVLLLRYGEFTALFTGDLERSGEAALLTRWEGEAIDLLKLGHHGSNTSNSEELLSAIRPGHAVVFPDLNRLDEAVEQRLVEQGCWLYDIGRRGAAVVETDGASFSLGHHEGDFSPAVAILNPTDF